MHAGNGWISLRNSCCTCSGLLLSHRAMPVTGIIQPDFQCAVLFWGFFWLPCMLPLPWLEQSQPLAMAPVWEALGTLVFLLASLVKTKRPFPSGDSKIFYMWEFSGFPWILARVQVGLLERESQSSHLQGQATEAVRCSGWIVKRLSQLSHDHPTTYKWTSLSLVLLQLWTCSS